MNWLRTKGMEMKTIAQTIGMLLDGLALGGPLLSRGLDSEGVRASVPGNDACGATSVAGDERHGVDNVEDSDGGRERTVARKAYVSSRIRTHVVQPQRVVQG